MRRSITLRKSWRQQLVNRRGISLIEVVAAASMGSLIVGLAVSALVLAIKNSDAAHDDLAARSELNRLARQFRRDVHSSRQALFEPATDLVTLSDGTRRIRYHQVGNSIERSEEVVASGALDSKQPPKRDAFRLPPDYGSAIEVVPAGASSLLRLRLAPAPEINSSVVVAQVSRATKILQTHTIDAWLGRDFRGAGVLITGTPDISQAPSAAFSSPAGMSKVASGSDQEVSP
jgi:hypothetical protein